MSGENWDSIDTTSETSAEFKARRQVERRFERWAFICDSHNCPWRIVDGEFVVYECWTIGEQSQRGEGAQAIGTTAELWQALGY